MILRKEVLQKIDTPKNRVQIAAAMGLGEQTIRQYIIKNSPKLTQYAAMQAIKAITGVKKDADLLEETTVCKSF